MLGREKGNIGRARGKREKVGPLIWAQFTRQPNFAYARPNETKRFPGSIGTPSSESWMWVSSWSVPCAIWSERKKGSLE